MTLVTAGILLGAQPAGITTALSSNDPAQIDRAIADIRAMLVGPTRFAAIDNLKGRWLRTLIGLKRYDDAAELAQAGVFAWPLRLADVEPLMKLRIEALLAAGKHQDALAAAKGLFNVSSMASTSEAINILHTCVRLAHADNPSALAQFRREQQRGAIVSDQPPRLPPSWVRRQDVLCKAGLSTALRRRCW